MSHRAMIKVLITKQIKIVNLFIINLTLLKFQRMTDLWTWKAHTISST